MSKKELKILTCAAFVALAVPCAAAPASAPSATGLPRNIVPVRPPEIEPPTGAIEPITEDNAPSDPPADADAPPELTLPPELSNPTSGLPRRAPAIEIGDLGTVEGPVAGLIDDSSGGLGATMWQGATRATVVAMLKSAPATTASDAQRLLMRKILLTTAPPPVGSAETSFNGLRLTKLVDAGLADDAADLALRMNAPQNGEIVRAQTDALIYAGRDADICGDLTARRLDSADASWVELRAYCYAVAKDEGALELTRAVIDAQGIADPAFIVLLDGMVRGKAVAPETIRAPDALHLLMLQRLKLPIPAEMSTLGVSAQLVMAASKETPTPLRVEAAEKALRAGVLPTPLFGDILATFRFSPAELVGAPAAARGEPMMSALARLRAAFKASQRADERADIIHTAFDIGQREGVLGQVALLFADEAATFFPPANWTNWSDLMVRGLLLRGQSDAALRWFAILNPDIPEMKSAAIQLALVLALAAPEVADDAVTRLRLSALALQATSAEAQNSPATVAHATLALGLFNALGRAMPPDAQAAVPALVRQTSAAGRRPAPALMQCIDNAVKSGAHGELALCVVAALGSQGVRDLAPDVIVRLVLALRSAGIQDAADALATEAMLLRPASGA